MNSFYAVWWRLGLSSRILLRFYAERFPRFAPTAIRFRWFAHLVVGLPVQSVGVLAALAVAVLVDLSAGLVLAAIVVAGSEVWFRLRFAEGGFVVAWRLAWWYRRVLPRHWADHAAKTRSVQAEVGTAKEPVSSARLRPVADHPKMSWLPSIDWPVVSWWVSPPPGRTFVEFAESAPKLAAAAGDNVTGIEVNYLRPHDSSARLRVSFMDVLAQRRLPKWADDTPPDPNSMLLLEDPALDDLDAAMAELDALGDRP